YRQALQRINESATHLSYRIDDLLMLIRQDEQLFQPTLTAMTLETIWQAVGRQANLLANSQQVIVESTHPAQANWQTLICYTDLDKLLMIIRIIVDNALRYDPKKQPLGLTLMLEPNQVSFQLSDQGIGIANDDLEPIFERYFRANNGKQYRPDGLGIGLTLAQSMAKQLNGEIKIASQLNQGSQVTLSFPLEEV
ncbi:MAG: sensor histidine kinase, partial [Vibrio metschnikovii]